MHDYAPRPARRVIRRNKPGDPDADESGSGIAPEAASLLGLQGAAGNESVARMLQGGAAPSPGTVQRAAPAPAAGPAAAPAPNQDVTAAAPPADAGLLPIYDKRTRGRVMVTPEQYEVERQRLGRQFRYLAKEIPADAKVVLEGYPFEAVKAMYAERMDDLELGLRAYARGDLMKAGIWAREARRYTDIEGAAHKLLLQEGALSYVGKRVSLAVVGIFEGAAETLLGLVDQGASLVGYHPGLAEWNARQYGKIKEGWSSVAGISHEHVSDDELGRFGGKVATGLAMAKAPTGLTATVINTAQAAAGVKDVVVTVHALRTSGQTWGAIFSDPENLAKVAGALAGVAGMGQAGIPHLRQFFEHSGLVLTGAQMTALTTAVVMTDDPKKRLDLLADLVTTAATTTDARLAAAKEARAAGAGDGGAGTTPSPAAGEGGPARAPTPVEGAVRTADDAAATGPAATPAAAAGRPAAHDIVASELLAIAVEAVPKPRHGPTHMPHGIPDASMATLQQVANQFEVVIKARPMNPAAAEALQAGALPKMELVKAKSINELDVLIGAPPDGLGLVGLFQPKEPPANLDPQVREAALKRKAERAEEYGKLSGEYKALEQQGLVRMDGPLLKVLDPRTPEGAAPGTEFKPVAGDIDIYDITHADGRPLSQDQRRFITNLLRSQGIGVEHGAHEWWPTQSPESFNQKAYEKIRAEHGGGDPSLATTPLVAITPGQGPGRVWADTSVSAPPRDAQGGRTTPLHEFNGGEPPPRTGTDVAHRPDAKPPIGDRPATPRPTRELPVLEGVTIDWSRKMSTSGYAGSLADAGPRFGVFPATLPSGEAVVVKVYPPGQGRRLAGPEMAALEAASRTGYGPDIHGRVAVEGGVAFVMERVEGAMPDHAPTGRMAPDDAARAVADAAAAQQRVSGMTVADVDTFRKTLLQEGYYYAGEVQGLVTPDGRWRPIDLQGVKPLPPETEPAARREAIKRHNAEFRALFDQLREILRARRLARSAS